MSRRGGRNESAPLSELYGQFAIVRNVGALALFCRLLPWLQSKDPAEAGPLPRSLLSIAVLVRTCTRRQIA
jgi:hypothetical protein